MSELLRRMDTPGCQALGPAQNLQGKVACEWGYKEIRGDAELLNRFSWILSPLSGSALILTLGVWKGTACWQFGGLTKGFQLFISVRNLLNFHLLCSRLLPDGTMTTAGSHNAEVMEILLFPLPLPPIQTQNHPQTYSDSLTAAAN